MFTLFVLIFPSLPFAMVIAASMDKINLSIKTSFDEVDVDDDDDDDVDDDGDDGEKSWS